MESDGQTAPSLESPEWRRHFKERLVNAEVLFSLWLPDNVMDLAPRLKWVHVYGAGVDMLRPTRILERGVRLSNSAGVNAPYIAEFVLAYMLMHVKKMPLRFEWQKSALWQRQDNDTLDGKTLGIIGLGNIGRQIAKRAAAFGMRTLGARRTVGRDEKIAHVDELYPLSTLDRMLPLCDFVVVSVALTSETRHLIGAREFVLMRPGAFFINVARGEVVQQEALIESLGRGHLAGAGLDVFTPEPLGAASPLWRMPNVILTSHNSASYIDHPDKSNQLFCENIKRYLDGLPLINEVAAATGY
jgi:phosphoglycerate dehydrogenase-like enzyme